MSAATDADKERAVLAVLDAVRPLSGNDQARLLAGMLAGVLADAPELYRLALLETLLAQIRAAVYGTR